MTWQDAGRYGRLCREIVNETGSRAICHVWTRQNSRHKTKDGTEPWPEGEANLALILQAPVMLEALEAIRDKADSMARITHHESWGDWEIVAGLARTAIAAVKGEGDDSGIG